MASKRKNEDPSADNTNQELSAKGGVHNTTAHVMREMNPMYFNPLPVILSGDNSEIFKKQKDYLETLSAITSSFDEYRSVDTTSESEHYDFGGSVSTKLSSKDVTDEYEGTSNARYGRVNIMDISKGTSTPRLDLADNITPYSSSTDDSSINSKSLHIIDKGYNVSSELEDIKLVSFLNTSGSNMNSDANTVPKTKFSGKLIERVRSRRMSPTSSKSGSFKTMHLKPLQFKTQKVKPKTFSRITIFKALQLKESFQKPFQKVFFKVLHFYDKPDVSEKLIQKMIPGEKIPDKYKTLQFFDDAEESALKSQPTKISEGNIVGKPLQFDDIDTKLQPAYPATSKLPPSSVEPRILKPIQFYHAAMTPVHDFNECETSEPSIISTKLLKILAIPKPLHSELGTETGYHSAMKPVHDFNECESSKPSIISTKPLKILAIPKPLHSELGTETGYHSAMKPVHDFNECESSKPSIISTKPLKILAIPKLSHSEIGIEIGYHSAMKPTKFAEGLNPIEFGVSMGPDIKHPSHTKLAESYPPGAELTVVSSATVEHASVKYPETISIDIPSHNISEEYFSMEHENSMEHFLNIFSLQNSPVLISKSALRDDVIVCTKSDVIISTTDVKKVTLDETIIDIPSVSIMSNKEVNEGGTDVKYGTSRASTSKRLLNTKDDNDDYEYEDLTGSEVKEALLSDFMKSDISEDALSMTFSSIMSMDHAVAIEIPERLAEVPSLPGIDKEKVPEIYEEMMQGRRRVRIPYSMMLMDEVTSSEDSVKIDIHKKKEKDGKKVVDKKTDKVHPSKHPRSELPKPEYPKHERTKSGRPKKKRKKVGKPKPPEGTTPGRPKPEDLKTGNTKSDKPVVQTEKLKKKKKKKKKKKNIFTKRLKTRLKDNRVPVHTGYFRDRQRRIDMVFVVDNTGEKVIERLKCNFLRNVAASGLEMEFEVPVQKRFAGLLFIKVHAPDNIIKMLADHYGIQKKFKEEHLNFAKSSFKNETALVTAIRTNYPGPVGFSTLERIAIVYKLLRTIPFGDPQNYRGIDRLLEAGIIRDYFPLHDGPFFLLNKKHQKKSQLNGRQALFYHWVGYYNIYSGQPIQLIREYLGERTVLFVILENVGFQIAFLFAFFQFYMYALTVPSLAGVLYMMAGLNSTMHEFVTNASCTKYGATFIVPKYVNDFYSYGITFSATYSFYTAWWTPWKNISWDCRGYKNWPCPYNYNTITYARSWLGKWKWYTYIATLSRTARKLGRIKNFGPAVYYDMPICPQCDDFMACPIVNLSYYCDRVKWKNLADNPYSIFYCAFFVIWGLLFARLWRRKENYLSWLWEVNEDDWNLKRPDYFVKKENVIYKAYSEAALSLTMLSIYVFAVVPVVIFYRERSMKNMMYYLQSLDLYWEYEYALFALVACFNGFIVLGSEVAYTKLVFHMHRSVHNQPTERDHELILTLKLYGFTVFVNFGFIFYTAFIKGAMYTYPSDPRSWRLPYGLGTTHCGVLSCIDELWIAHVVTFLAKRCFNEYDNMFESYTNEMSHGKWTNKHVPCWEKEYELRPLTEDIIMSKYNILMLQITVVSFFAWLFPAAGFLVIFLNMYEIRWWADEILLYSRRPLPSKNWGLGAWGYVLQAMPFMAGFINIASYARLSNIIPMITHQLYFPSTRYFVDYAMGFYNFSDFENESLSLRDVPEERGAYEWYQYSQLGSFNKHLYPHWWDAHFCLFPSMYSRQFRPDLSLENRSVLWMDRKIMRSSYVPNMNHWYIYWQKGLLIVAFEQFVVIAAMLINLLIDNQSPKVRTTRDAEALVKTTRLTKDDETFQEDAFKLHETEANKGQLDDVISLDKHDKLRKSEDNKYKLD